MVSGSSWPLLVAIVGPTAAGKTALSLELAERLGGEIVSADSRQIYRGMDIGSAKATPAEQARAPHHLLDLVDPDQVLTLAEYQRLAYRAIADIHGRGRVPLLVGGSGQHVAAILEGWRIPEVAPQPALRAALAADAAAAGAEALHARLAALDPAAASRIDHRNVRRVIRALEVCLVTGRPISELQRKEPPAYRIVRIGVTRPRPVLYERIDRRVDRMVEAGLVDEVRRLADAGYGWDLPALTGLGYRQIGLYLRGEKTLAEAVALVKQATRRFVQQQYNWFPLDDPAIRWLDPDYVTTEEALAWMDG
ncbi:MAG: tRNA dimethylallyltransferase [Chloroflexi bacterium ADurb.Bin325]|nr:MAG: tRNA dimethylallyltransferase [Chloroflexi bacterium ADurb.Bin325]